MPVLLIPGDLCTPTLGTLCAGIRTPFDSTQLNLCRQLLLGSTYAFEIAAIDAKGRVSNILRSQEFQLP